ncbi:polysaccharide biosynthesis tyrosine autokinase [Agrobacterium sp. a22-2]|nr:polysaccharide biosynthesis tyrosine autokinase [Agrobacterium sp. a22-2]NKN35657.1 polysaccharide biosynthesis tyrosine autokinase [Agrobacterium sp. a22-2]
MLSPDRIASRHRDGQRDDWDSNDTAEDGLDIDKLISIFRRQWRVGLVAIVAAVVVAALYVFTAVPMYTSAASVLIDRSNSEIVNQLSTIGSMVDDEASVLSQVELLKSDTIALAVVSKLKLADDPAFLNNANSPLSSVIGFVRSLFDVSSWFAAEKPLIDETEARTRQAVGIILDNLSVVRAGRSYVLQIGYTSRSAEQAAYIANALADAYLLDKLNSKYDATRRASDWLQERIDELKLKALESDFAVQKFRGENGLVAADGKLITDQQLSELNSALIVAQAETAKAAARYDRIKSIIDAGRTDAIVTDVLESSISNDLRKKFLEASKMEAEISSRLGPNHIQAVRLRSEMREFERLMFEELGRIAESYQSEVTVAQSRESALRQSVKEAQGVSAIAGETQVQLRELERTAETYRNLYQTFLQRFQEATQQQSFPITEARVISRATPPTAPSHPRKSLVLALSIVLGGALGAGLGAFREFRDRFFRTGDQVREALGLEFLGTVPLVAIEPYKIGPNDSEHPRNIRKVNSINNYVVDHPLSMFAETLRSAKIAIDLSVKENRAKVIGIVSTLPGEGKSTVAVNFAELLAMQGARTLLIDSDLRNPGATRAIGRNAEAGLLEALIDNRPVRDLLLLNQKTKLAFLPAVVTRRVPHSSELLASPAMNAIIETAKTGFDYIVLDLPPLGPVVDARAIASRVDSFIYVIEWGNTSRKAVKSILASDMEVYDKCAGVVLNKVDEDKMKLYRAYGSSEYYSSRYLSYYRED